MDSAEKTILKRTADFVQMVDHLYKIHFFDDPSVSTQQRARMFSKINEAVLPWRSGNRVYFPIPEGWEERMVVAQERFRTLSNSYRSQLGTF
jgi:hypothetical protein